MKRLPGDGDLEDKYFLPVAAAILLTFFYYYSI
jgi:hypothetical protein